MVRRSEGCVPNISCLNHVDSHRTPLRCDSNVSKTIVMAKMHETIYLNVYDTIIIFSNQVIRCYIPVDKTRSIFTKTFSASMRFKQLVTLMREHTIKYPTLVYFRSENGMIMRCLSLSATIANFAALATKVFSRRVADPRRCLAN